MIIRARRQDSGGLPAEETGAKIDIDDDGTVTISAME